jgi:4-amino-4-deoxy-L-arabinose transferase-like glycosyltransferase
MFLETMENSRTNERRHGAIRLLQPILIAVVFFIAVAPTLSWLEFTSGIETLNVATVLEMRRGGPWFLPTLEGKPRIEKPPLTAWITSLGVRQSTLAALDDPNADNRVAAYARLAWEMRWTALLTGALTLLATYALARAVSDHRTALIATVVCASSFFFLRYVTQALIDVHLMLLVALAQIFLVGLILDGVTWTNCLGAGIAMGLAFMAKGPVAFALTLIPSILFAMWRGSVVRRQNLERQTPARRANLIKLAAGTLVMFIVGLWWFAVIAARDPSVIRTWLQETSPAGAAVGRSDSVFSYFIIIPLMLPWTVLMIDGCIRGVAAMIRATRTGAEDSVFRRVYPAAMLVASLLLMTCFHDRKDRYILPLVPVTAIVVAQSAVAMLDRRRNALPDWTFWIVLLMLALLPLLGVTPVFLKNTDGGAWYSVPFCVTVVTTGLVIVVTGMLASRRWRGAMIAAGSVLMIFLYAVGMRGYTTSDHGHSDMRPLAELIRAEYPNAEMYNWRSNGLEKRLSVDLSIYLNRSTYSIASPAELPHSARPQIIVVPQDKGSPDPRLPAEWNLLKKSAHGENWYVVFVRLPS